MVAARVSGNATSAFANGPPAGVTAAPDALKASAKPLNVVVIADTDLLADFMWGQSRNFFGQSMFQPFANNGELVWNALDNLAGSNDLISIRGRASYSRPFDRVEALRRNAESQFRAKEQQLETELNQTEETLSKLQTAQPRRQRSPALGRTGARDRTLPGREAAHPQGAARGQVRARERHQGARHVDEVRSTSCWCRWSSPCVALLVAFWHRRRRHAIAMLRKGSAP